MEFKPENFSQKPSNPDVKTNSSENLDIKIELAGPDEWESCKKMRIEALKSDDADMLEKNPKKLKQKLEKEEAKTEAEWREELSKEEMLTFLPKNNQVPIGIGRASHMEKGIWILHNGYLKKEFQGKNIGKKMFVSRLNEIIRRGGVKARTSIKANNDRMIHIAEGFGFKEMTTIEKLMAAKKIISKQWKPMEADLTNPDILKKIDEVLNER